ncbi:ATP-dependent DNA helicase RecG [Candidatus Gracilibacteria bacterium]|nr:ATP-dependent DNA helicase RecG [Candidatus Gracilibacteria bacterium]OIO77436.1 MAG: ATP-dependent DNA helicase RecG [Candidatus Gracilibacteria bacterium CG1_02_38_174]PIQ10854.1 MAG: ATP-dependent DNA helicase RecG [Candidatus Gracilibacteria bacterium CG18_big_fil_WC_8_21_14_2_50_38_16]PIQ41203.1 MAG: ATP-dependent DNA helicase RecG [Candidatus Gracilibacteria bacterium CG12_big_fil_rev_8_21_14_0_65_38_15]PIZ01524.1 MAG: ATP-dependent DNA helicase RecG [Candidatus Gracilibacteria bacteri
MTLLNKTLLHTTDSYIKRLQKGGISTVEDLIGHYPRTYKDKSDVLELFSYVNIKEPNTLRVKIESLTTERTRNGKELSKAVLADKSGFLSEAVWFNRKYMLQKFHAGDTVKIYGKPKYEYGRLSFPSPDIEFAKDEGSSIVPVYPECNYIPSAWFEGKMVCIREYIRTIPEVLPEEIRKQKGFRTKAVNITAIHFPTSKADFERARTELAYEELFSLQYEGIMRKKSGEEASAGRAIPIPMNPETVKEIISKLPFPLTNGQKVVLFQILKDMERPFAMQRLLQGDVGTGKTIVVMIAAIHAILESRKIPGNIPIQVAILAPTEILARQHFASSMNLLSSFGITSDFLVGGLTSKQKTDVKARLKNGDLSVVIGTHALIEDTVHFENLALTIVDEQHRFGVEQRRALEQYSSHKTGGLPHVLNMTATPIPRTLSLTIYGDQDISVLSEYPVGRLPIHTKVLSETERNEAYNFIATEVQAGRQVYWISPLVEESETLDIASAVNMQEILQSVFPTFRVGLIHGKMKAREKDAIMQAFYERKIDILSSTSVVEVGVDNPNASVICIEAAERFGLSQLHQFRGRVGRGKDQSYCYLFTTKSYTGERLRAMERTNDGFELSEIDLELRGPGEVYGVRQSGVPEFKIADLKDLELVSEIREDIEEYMIKK